MKKIDSWLLIGTTICIPIIWVILKFSGWQWEKYPIPTSCITGIAVVSAAFILCWAAEAAQKDISQVLAIVFLALIAVLPEYAVDIYLVWIAGKDPSYISYAAANMTGSNRLLIGLGWSAMVFLYWIKTRDKKIDLEESRKIELSFLTLATLYSFVIPIKGCLSIIDTIILLSLFVWYIITATKANITEPELDGVAQQIGMLPAKSRRVVVVSLFVYAAFIIFISAEPFSEGLIGTGKHFGINEFLLIQWLAPIASESPEFIAAALFVLKAKPNFGLGTLISSKVNQWTLLVGLLPAVFCISSGKLGPMILDSRQIHELFLTSAQSIFAIALVMNLRLSITSALMLFGLFFIQLIFSETRLIISYVYLGLTCFLVIKNRKGLKNVFTFKH